MIDIDGRAVHVDIRGAGGPPVVLEAGIAASSLSWALVAAKVAEFTTVVSYDRAGFGWSEAAPHRATALDAARDLALVLEHAAVQGPVVVVGHSFGGLIARVFEQTYPARVAGMVLVDPVVRAEWRDADAARRRMLARGVALSRRGAVLARIGVVGFALRRLTGGSRVIPKLLARVSAGRGAGVTERLTGEVRKMPRDLWPMVAAHWSEARSFRAMADTLESLPVSVRQIDESRSLGDLPVVVLSAKETPEHQHDARLSRRGDYLVVPDSGHWMQLDAPDAVVSAIRRVIAAAGGS
jgi:pimeloyl-ACP methyl ester carboxylesterase